MTAIVSQLQQIVVETQFSFLGNWGQLETPRGSICRCQSAQDVA
jgi:hypothetical protein